MSILVRELQSRLTALYAGLAAGEDLPPSRQLRAEGLMEAAVLTGTASEEELTGALESCYQQVYARSLEQDFGADWRDFYPFPQIPALARRAPVYPSTPD